MKRFFVTLGFSIGVWVVTVIIQAFVEAPKYIVFFTQSKGSATGYPVSDCIKGIPEIFIYLVNIFFWFWIFHLLGNWFNNKGGSKS